MWQLCDGKVRTPRLQGEFSSNKRCHWLRWIGKMIAILCKYGWKHLQSLPGRISEAHLPAAAKVYASARRGRHSVSNAKSRRIGMTRSPSAAYQCEHKLQCSRIGLPWQHCSARMYLIRYHYSRQLGICQFTTLVPVFAQRLTWVIDWGGQVRKMLKGSF